MPLTFAEKVKIICNRKNITIKDLAESLGTTRQNLTNKLSRDNFLKRKWSKFVRLWIAHTIALSQ